MSLWHRKCIFTLILVFGGILESDAQVTSGMNHPLSTHGREIVFATFTNIIGRSHHTDILADAIYISSTTDCSCILNLDDGFGRTDKSIPIKAFEVTTYKLSSLARLADNTKVEQKGMYLNCTDDVTVYMYNHPDHPNSYALLPVSSLTTDYLIPSTNGNPLIGVVATTPSTTVHVILNSTCVVEYNSHLYFSGNVMSFTLDDKDVLQVVYNSSRFSCDFSGTVIQTSSPAAVFSGSVSTSSTNQTSSNIMLQVPPFTAYSNTIIVPHVPFPATWMKLRVLASQDNTSVNVSSQQAGAIVASSFTIQRGELHSLNFTADADVIVHSDKPVMVLQYTYFDPLDGELSMFVPGTDLYQTEYVVPSTLVYKYELDMKSPVLTVVADSSTVDWIYFDDKFLTNMHWKPLIGSSYSVGTTEITDQHPYHINSASPILVRLHQFLDSASCGYIAGYTRNEDNMTNITETERVRSAVHLDCLTDSWIVSVEVAKLSLRRTDIPQIYLGVHTCKGVLNGSRLVFNASYDDCHTVKTVADDKFIFTNTLVYAPLSEDNLVRGIQWSDDIQCSHPLHATDSVHIYPVHNSSNHVTVSGQIKGAQVHISLFKDASFQTPFIAAQHKAQLGQPIYVQVAVSSSNSIVMIVNSCHAHLTSNPGNVVPHLLIDKGCSKEKQTQILATRNHVMRFKFDMFEFPNEDDGMYVSCDVTFCGTMDFSPNCQLGCHTDQHPGLVGK